MPVTKVSPFCVFCLFLLVVLTALFALTAVTHDPKAPLSEGTVHTDRDGNQTNAGEAYNQAQQAKDEAYGQKENAKGQAGGLKEQAKQVGSQKLREGQQAYREDGIDGVKQHGQNMKNDADNDVNLFWFDLICLGLRLISPHFQDNAQGAKSKFAAFKNKLTPGDNARGSFPLVLVSSAHVLNVASPSTNREERPAKGEGPKLL